METVNTPAPVTESQTTPDPEAAQWASLMEEMEQEETGSEGAPAAESKPPEGQEPPEQEAAEEPAKPEPTQLDNLNKALRAERAEKQALAQRLNNYDEFIKQLRETRGQKQEQPKAPEQPQIPDVDADPVGHFQAQVAVLRQQVEQLTQGTTQTQQQLQAQSEEQAFWNHVIQSEQVERAATPPITLDGKQVSDYDLACQHLEATRVAELEMMLPDESPAAIQQAHARGLRTPAELRDVMLNQDRIAVARHAIALGMSPAKLYYSLAKQRGYQSPQQQVDNRPKQQLEAAKRGQRAASTISGGGTGTKNDLNVADLTDLYSEDPEEFDKMWDQMAARGQLG